jgi:hypothetical protein
MSEPLQWEDVLAKGSEAGVSTFTTILSAIVLENGGSMSVSVMSLRELVRGSSQLRLVAEVDSGQLVVSLMQGVSVN